MEMYSSHLAGVVQGNLSINTFSPSKIALSSQFGGGSLKIEGGFPLEQSSKINFNLEQAKEFTAEFRMPSNTSILQVTVNEKKVEVKQNDRGFFEYRQTWKDGDVMTIQFKYELKAHLEEGEEGKRWVAFTYGPLALAQKIERMPGEEPFLDSDFTNPDELLGQLTKSAASNVEFNITGANTTLIPYYQTGTKKSGPKTYFKVKN
jgi:DUF1680 family protein